MVERVLQMLVKMVKSRGSGKLQPRGDLSGRQKDKSPSKLMRRKSDSDSRSCSKSPTPSARLPSNGDEELWKSLSCGSLPDLEQIWAGKKEFGDEDSDLEDRQTTKASSVSAGQPTAP